MAEILLYGGFDAESVAEFIGEINEAVALNPSDTINVRVNTPGGSPEYGWGAVAKFAELKNKSVVVDGKAHSMGLYFCCYTEDATCLDVTEFCLHRAAYPSWFEKDPNLFDEATKGNLERINTSLRKAFENKVDAKKFEEVKGVKLKDIFSMDSRIDCFITAKEAKQIGLVNKIVTITPQKKAEIESLLQAKKGFVEIAANTNSNNNKMENLTLVELQAKFPAVFAEAVAIGVRKEKARVEAWAMFADVDAKAVTEGIKSGEECSTAKGFEFMQKKFSAASLATIESQAAPATTNTAPVEGSPEAIKAAKEAKEKAEKSAAFEAELNKHLGIVK